MISLPSPLHPAIVHFPIVLVLIGTALALVAAFTSRWHVRWFAGILLTLGAVGVVVAAKTGAVDMEMIDRPPAMTSLLEEHETWAERAEILSLIAAGFSLAVLAAMRWVPRAAPVVAAVCAITASGASLSIYETGHRGGQMVYRHGAGVNVASAQSKSPSTAATAATDRPQDARHRDDD